MRARAVQDFPYPNPSDGEARPEHLEGHFSFLNFVAGDMLRVMKQDDESGWWAGHKEGDSVTGWFPATAVQVVLSTKLPEPEVPAAGQLLNKKAGAATGEHETTTEAAAASAGHGPLSRLGRKVATPFGNSGGGAGSRVTPRPITQGMQDRRSSGSCSRQPSWEVRTREPVASSSEANNIGFGGRTRKPTSSSRPSLDGQKALSPCRATPGIVEPIATSRRGSPTGPGSAFNILAVRRAERKLNGAGGSYTPPQVTPKVIRNGPRGSLQNASPSPSPCSSLFNNNRRGGVGTAAGYRGPSSPSPGPSGRTPLSRRTAVSNQTAAVQERQAIVEAKTTAWIDAMRSVDELSARLAADGQGSLSEGGLADHEKIARLVTKLESDRARLQSYAMEVRSLQDQICQQESERARANSFADEVRKLNERLCQQEAERARARSFEEEVRSLQERLCQQDMLMSALESARELLALSTNASTPAAGSHSSVKNLQAHETINHMISRLRVEMDRSARLSEEVQNLRRRVAHLEEMALHADLEGSLSMSSNEPSSILAVAAGAGSESIVARPMGEAEQHAQAEIRAAFSGVFGESLERLGRGGESPRRVRSVREIVAHFERGQRPVGAPAWLG